jgi:two-component sensor histidine kinase
LALALVASSDTPILVLDEVFCVVAASDSFIGVFGLDSKTVVGHPVFAMGGGEWDVPQLRSLLKATLSGAAEIATYEMDLKRQGTASRRLVITAHELVHDDTSSGAARLLLSVFDVTDARMAARLRDDLVREKALLFEELQHRVANSLQIIASVLMQNARRVPAETRPYLVDAHSRVMSVAALQHQLAVSSAGDVDLNAYFTELCESIAASMIPDREKLNLTVSAESGVASADLSVSLGLVVTELVINALKHAFPDGRRGKIVVGYLASAADWTLSVSDDGVGMKTGPKRAKGGLGTSIVQALAKQLGADVRVVDNKPGTRVSLIHRDASVLSDEAKAAPAV